MRRVDRIDQGLQRWSAWRVFGRSNGSSAYINSAYDPNRVSQTSDVRAGQGPRLGVDDRTMVQYERAVASLPDDIRAAVVAVYSRQARPMEAVAQHLGITRRTLHTRLCHADARIEQYLAARQQQNQFRNLHTSGHNSVNSGGGHAVTPEGENP